MNEPTAEILLGDCRDMLKELPDNSIDSIVTDPPYELGFMGKGWDKSGIAYDPAVWRECLRVLKPGGHLLAFSGTRTYHRMVCAIEDAGFEIRDQIGWLYGSGFPKSLDVSKAINKAAGAEREVIGKKKAGMGSGKTFGMLQAEGDNSNAPSFVPLTVPATAAAAWDGWGTALKPAWEPIVLARKPLIGTVVENVLTHRTGGINVGGCRVPSEKLTGWGGGGGGGQNAWKEKGLNNSGEPRPVEGRWPANVIHDGSEEVLEEFAKYGESTSRASVQVVEEPNYKNKIYGRGMGGTVSATNQHSDSGTPARFFYCAKASKSDRNEGCEDMPLKVAGGMQGRADGSMGSITYNNNHPTVKPAALMRYLCRLVTPPGGTVLDPFTGSGSTGKAAIAEGFNFVGVELSEEYAEIAIARINAAGEQKEST